MNNEEAIQKIEELLNLANWYPKYGYKQAIITALAYIKELEEEKQQVLDDYQELGKDLANNFISKDKVRDKIEELEEKSKKYQGMQGLRYSEIALDAARIQVLKELLEENK